MNYILTGFAVLALIGLLFVVFINYFAVEKPEKATKKKPRKPKLKEGDKIKLPFDMIALMGGIEDAQMQVLIKDWYRLTLFKKTKERLYFRVTFNDDKKSEIVTGQIVSFTTDTFACLAYKTLT